MSLKSNYANANKLQLSVNEQILVIQLDAGWLTYIKQFRQYKTSTDERRHWIN